MAGPGRVRSAGDRRLCGLRGGGQRDGRKLDCSRTRPPSLAHSLLARSLPPSLRAACPPACCLLPAHSLARPPGFRRSRRTLRHSQSPGLRRGCARPCAAALRFGSGRSSPAHISRVPAPGKRQVRGWVAESCVRELSLKKTRELFDFSLARHPLSSKGPSEPLPL